MIVLITILLVVLSAHGLADILIFIGVQDLVAYIVAAVLTLSLLLMAGHYGKRKK